MTEVKRKWTDKAPMERSLSLEKPGWPERFWKGFGPVSMTQRWSPSLAHRWPVCTPALERETHFFLLWHALAMGKLSSVIIIFYSFFSSCSLEMPNIFMPQGLCSCWFLCWNVLECSFTALSTAFCTLSGLLSGVIGLPHDSTYNSSHHFMLARLVLFIFIVHSPVWYFIFLFTTTEVPYTELYPQTLMSGAFIYVIQYGGP